MIRLAANRLEAVAAQFTALIDPVAGLIGDASEAPHLYGEPAFPLVTARLASVDRLYRIAGFSPAAAGTALNPLEARVRACGEAAERYAGFLFSAEAGVRAVCGDLPGRAVPPNDWPRCRRDEYAHPANPLSAPDPARPYDWVAGRSLLTGEQVWLPALQVCLGYLPADPAELITLPHSTGLAAGTSAEAATLSGLCEVLERDAFMLTWGKQLPAPRLLLPAAAWPEVAERVRRLSRCGLDLQLHALREDEPPAKVLALIRDRSGGPVPVACGLGASPDPRRAAAKAIDEAVQSRRGLVEMTQHGGFAKPASPDEIENLSDHLAFYLNPDRLPAFAFLDQAPAIPAESLPGGGAEPSATLARLVEALDRQGYEPVWVNITPPDLAEAGFTVVRVVVPGLIPLAHGHSMRFLASPRWDRFPGPINPFPHPFG